MEMKSYLPKKISKFITLSMLKKCWVKVQLKTNQYHNKKRKIYQCFKWLVT